MGLFNRLLSIFLRKFRKNGGRQPERCEVAGPVVCRSVVIPCVHTQDVSKYFAKLNVECKSQGRSLPSFFLLYAYGRVCVICVYVRI